MTQAKLTQTFNDTKGNIPPSNGAAPKRGRPRKITEVHEPVGTEPWVPQAPFYQVSQQITPAAFMAIPQQPPVAPVVEPLPLKVALIGTAPSSRLLAPFNDPTWKIWACSPGNQGMLPRVDVWFELHGNLLWPECRSYGVPYIEWMKQQKFPIYMQDQSNVPNALTFPKDDLVKEFGKDFFTSSFAWMMAFAITQGAKEIALYGIDMASRDEYVRQRPGFFYFKNEAARRGVKVSAPNESDIMQPPGLYGYSEVTPFGRKVLARKAELSERINGLRQQRDGAAHQLTYLEGAMEDIDYFEQIWTGVSAGVQQKSE